MTDLADDFNDNVLEPLREAGIEIFEDHTGMVYAQKPGVMNGQGRWLLASPATPKRPPYQMPAHCVPRVLVWAMGM